MVITRRTLRLIVALCVGLTAMPALATEVFFSTVGNVGGAVALDNPMVTHARTDGAGSLYIWSTDDQNYDTTIGMNVVSSVPGILSFSDGEVFNPDIVSDALGGLPFDVRWSAAAAGVSPDAVERMNGVRTFSGTGILVENNGTAAPLLLRDELYDVPAGAFLLAAVHYDIIGVGTTSLSVNQEDTALFVNAGQQIFPEFGSAIIRVVPEPPSVALIGIGLIGLAWACTCRTSTSLCVICLSLAAQPVCAASVFFSVAGSVGDGVTLGAPIVSHTLAQESGSIYVWCTDDQNYDSNIGMNVVSETPGVIVFSGAEVLNADIVSDATPGGGPVGTRWQLLHTGVNSDIVEAMNGTSTAVFSGILRENDGRTAPFLLRDELYDVPAGAFLLAAVHYDIIGVGTTSLSINQEDTVLFVNADQQIFPEFGSAMIRVIPEPSTFILCLVVLAVIGGWWKWADKESGGAKAAQ